MAVGRDVKSGYELLNTLNLYTEDKEKIPKSLINKIINNENYKKYIYLGLPNEQSLKNMDIEQLFLLYNTLDLIEEAYTSLERYLIYGDISYLSRFTKPDFTDYNSLKGFIGNLNNPGNTNPNYHNLENPFDFFDMETIKSLKPFKRLDINKLRSKEHVNLSIIVNNRNALYCIDKKEYDNYLNECIQIVWVKQQKKEAEKRLKERQKVQRHDNINRKVGKTIPIIQLIVFGIIMWDLITGIIFSSISFFYGLIIPTLILSSNTEYNSAITALAFLGTIGSGIALVVVQISMVTGFGKIFELIGVLFLSPLYALLGLAAQLILIRILDYIFKLFGLDVFR